MRNEYPNVLSLLTQVLSKCLYRLFDLYVRVLLHFCPKTVLLPTYLYLVHVIFLLHVSTLKGQKTLPGGITSRGLVAL